ncbi:hypothetical protein [Candidatus Lokiarchaeum ossiferum]|uniref:hypothetical protein n=1 Tax=Candidatus Lokiarchaeum ossiferum TaxID=2951803 RepID=UPI00352F17BD
MVQKILNLKNRVDFSNILDSIKTALIKRNVFGPDHALGFLLGELESQKITRDLSHVQKISQKMISNNQAKIAEGYISHFMESTTAQQLISTLEIEQKQSTIMLKKPTKDLAKPTGFIIQSLQCNKTGLTIRNLVGYINITYKHVYTDTQIKIAMKKLIQEGYVIVKERNNSKIFCISEDHRGDVKIITGIWKG